MGPKLESWNQRWTFQIRGSEVNSCWSQWHSSHKPPAQHAVLLCPSLPLTPLVSACLLLPAFSISPGTPAAARATAWLRCPAVSWTAWLALRCRHGQARPDLHHLLLSQVLDLHWLLRVFCSRAPVLIQQLQARKRCRGPMGTHWHTWAEGPHLAPPGTQQGSSKGCAPLCYSDKCLYAGTAHCCQPGVTLPAFGRWPLLWKHFVCLSWP